MSQISRYIHIFQCSGDIFHPSQIVGAGSIKSDFFSMLHCKKRTDLHIDTFSWWLYRHFCSAQIRVDLGKTLGDIGQFRTSNRMADVFGRMAEVV